MADVQLAHGFLQVANELDEAMTFAPFSGPQAKIVRCIVRLTYGWRRRTVRVSVTEIAERCNEKYSGAFRRSFLTLITEGVLLELQPAAGRRAGLYAINKNYEAWGRFSVAPRTLERLFRIQLPSFDAALDGDRCSPPEGRTNEDENDNVVRPSGGEQDAAVNSPSGGEQTGRVDSPLEGEQRVTGATVVRPSEGEQRDDSTNVDSPSEGEQRNGPENLVRPPEGEKESCKSFSGETYEGPKYITTTTQHISRACAREEPQPTAPAAAPRAWLALSDRLETDDQRSRVARFLASCAVDDREQIAETFSRWLDGHDCPPSYRPTPAVLVAALGEYKGDRRVMHIWRFVEDVVRRFERAAGSGRHGVGVFPATRTTPNGAMMLQRIVALIERRDVPGQGNWRVIPREKVEALGAEVFAAYTAIGGADRVIAASQDPKDMSYAIRDFSAAFDSAIRQLPALT